GIVDEVRRHLENRELAVILDAVALEGAEVVGIAELASKLLEESPIALLSLRADELSQVSLEISRYAIVVENRIGDIDEKNDAHCLSAAGAKPLPSSRSLPLHALGKAVAIFGIRELCC